MFDSAWTFNFEIFPVKKNTFCTVIVGILQLWRNINFVSSAARLRGGFWILKIHPFCWSSELKVYFYRFCWVWDNLNYILSMLLKIHLGVVKLFGRCGQCQAGQIICFASCDNFKLIWEIHFWLAPPKLILARGVSSFKSERGEAEKRKRQTKFLSFWSNSYNLPPHYTTRWRLGWRW